MPNYKATFRTDAEFAVHDFEARSPRDALKKARALYDDHAEELSFESYNGGHPVTEIAVRDSEGDKVAVWQDDELRLHHAAGDLLEALELCVHCLADLARLDDGTPSISALNQARAAIARAKPETVAATIVGTAQPLPSDPGKMNGERAECVAAALRQFQRVAGCDHEDSLGDLLADLMHWSDRNGSDFEAALTRARGHYEAETAAVPR